MRFYSGTHNDASLPMLWQDKTAINFDAFAGLTQGSATRKLARFCKQGVLMDIAKVSLSSLLVLFCSVLSVLADLRVCLGFLFRSCLTRACLLLKLEEFCRTNLGNVTFIEAYRQTGRVINITLGVSQFHSGAPPLLNFLVGFQVVFSLLES